MAVEKKNPKFIRADAHKKKRLGSGWRKPTGWQNKMRLQKRGYRVIVKPGYMSEVSTRDTFNGKKIVTVHNLNEFKVLDPSVNAVILAGVGRRKKESLIAYAKDKKFDLVNFSVEKYVAKTKLVLDEKKKHKDYLASKEKPKLAKEEKASKKKAKAKSSSVSDSKLDDDVKEDKETVKVEKPSKDSKDSKVSDKAGVESLLSEEDKKVAEKKVKDKILISKKEQY